MKRIISIVLSILIIISTVSISYADDNIIDSNSYVSSALSESEIDSIAQMINEYDDGKDFVSYDEYVIEQPSSYGSNELEKQYEERYEFQTSRLFVKSYESIDLLNSIDYKNIDDNTYLLQFESEADTERAYDYYNALDYIEYVEPDAVYSSTGLVYKGDINEYFYNPDNSNFDTYDVNNAMTKSDDVSALKQYVIDNASNLYDEIKVAVIDSGVKKEHEAITGRFACGKDFATGQDNQGGVDTFGHGTEVASVVVDTSLPNTKIYSYRVGVTGDYSESYIILSFKQAILDDIDIINCSFSSNKNSSALCDAVNEAHDNNISIIAAAGNESTNLDSNPRYPAFYRNVVAVGSGGNKATYFSNYGSDVQLYAFMNPNVAYVTDTEALDEYKTQQGTSYSAPAVAGACAMLRTLYRNETNDQITMRLWNGATQKVNSATSSVPLKNGYKVSYLNSALLDTPYVETTEKPTITVTDLPNGNKQVSISHPDNDATIWYSTGGGSNNEGLMSYEIYKEPFTVSRFINVWAYAKSDKKIKSEFSRKYVTTGYYKNGFYCDNDGIIVKFIPEEYEGDLENIIVPDSIHGITITSFGKATNISLFDSDFKKKIKSIILPKSIKTIGTTSFDYSNIESVVAPGVSDIQHNAFSECKKLNHIEFSAELTIGYKAFYGCENLSDFTPFENIKNIPEYAFYNCGFKNVYLPFCESIDRYAFDSCSNLKYINLPKITSIGENVFSNIDYLEEVSLLNCLGELPYNVFDNSSFKYIELGCDYPPNFENSTIEYIYLPYCIDIWNADFALSNSVKRAEYETIEAIEGFPEKVKILSIPSSVNQITDDDYIPDATIYGTADENNLIYNWCIDNGVTFKNIAQENALMTDLPMEITDADTELEADVIGFNRTYQWYSNDVADNTSGTAIEGATSKYFTPSDYPLPDYYYCVVTSTDGDYEPVTIRTGVTANKSNIAQVDYSAYNAAMATAQAVIDNPNYSDKYDADTRSEFENRLSELTLDMSTAHSQAEIDSTTNSILVLINNLKVNDYVIEFKVFINNSECYSDTINKSYADNISFDLSDISGMDYSSYSVERWTINSDNVTSSTVIARGNKALERVVTDDITISAYLVSKPTDEKEYSKVTLLSPSGAIVNIGYVEKGSTIDTSSAAVLCGDDVLGTASIIPFYSFGGWRLNDKAVTDVSADNDITLKAEYIYTADTCKVISGSDSVFINSQYNPSGYNAAYDEKIYVKSADDKQLAMYNENGDFISFIKNTGYISAPKASAIIIREVDEVKPSTAITGAFFTDLDGDKDKVSFNCQFFLPDGCRLIECGAVMTGNKAIADNEQAFVIGAQKTLKAISQSQSENNEYTISLIADYTGKDAFYGRSYLIYSDENGNRKIIYGNIHQVNINKGA